MLVTIYVLTLSSSIVDPIFPKNKLNIYEINKTLHSESKSFFLILRGIEGINTMINCRAAWSRKARLDGENCKNNYVVMRSGRKRKKHFQKNKTILQ